MELMWVPSPRVFLTLCCYNFVAGDICRCKFRVNSIFYKFFKQRKQACWGVVCSGIAPFLFSCLFPTTKCLCREVTKKPAETNLTVGVVFISVGWLLPLCSLLVVLVKQRGQKIKEHTSFQPGLYSSWCSSADPRYYTWGWIWSINFSRVASGDNVVALRSWWGNSFKWLPWEGGRYFENQKRPERIKG